MEAKPCNTTELIRDTKKDAEAPVKCSVINPGKPSKWRFPERRRWRRYSWRANAQNGSYCEIVKEPQAGYRQKISNVFRPDAPLPSRSWARCCARSVHGSPGQCSGVRAACVDGGVDCVGQTAFAASLSARGLSRGFVAVGIELWLHFRGCRGAFPYGASGRLSSLR